MANVATRPNILTAKHEDPLAYYIPIPSAKTVRLTPTLSALDLMYGYYSAD